MIPPIGSAIVTAQASGNACPERSRGAHPVIGRKPNADREIGVPRAYEGAGCDFVFRVFAPCLGIDEDPVTGSAHCALGPFWAGRLGKTAMASWQASARGGTVKVVVAGDRVRLAGRAGTVFSGTLADEVRRDRDH